MYVKRTQVLRVSSEQSTLCSQLVNAAKVVIVKVYRCANPIYYMMDAFRLGFLGVGSVELWKAFLVPVSMIIVLALVANKLLNRGVSIKTE